MPLTNLILFKLGLIIMVKYTKTLKPDSTNIGAIIMGRYGCRDKTKT